jgi:NAD(P)-dependent dehydrogenase (short-subunit alcohol dehydrogenase family)
MTDVSGKVAFITGGGSGVGFGQARVFAEAGCKVAIADIRKDHLAEAMDYFNSVDVEVMPIELDITDRDAYGKAADSVESWLGPVQLLFNTAGVSIFGPLQDATPEDWEWNINVNLWGMINGTKMAVRGLSECLAMDLAETNVKVSMLCPGAVNTNIHESVLSRPKHLANTGYYGANPEVFAALKQVIEVGMEPETLAQYVLQGIRNNDLYILPFPEFRGTLEEIHQRVMAALANPEDDPEYEKRVAHGVPGGKKS